MGVVSADLEFLLFLQDGVVSRRQALRHMSEKAIRHRIGSGRWQTAHPGIYLTHSGAMTEHQRRWVASLAIGRGHAAMLGGLSALSDQNEIAIAGERLLRFPAWMIRHKPDEVLTQLRAALAAAGWTSGDRGT